MAGNGQESDKISVGLLAAPRPGRYLAAPEIGKRVRDREATKWSWHGASDLQ